MDESLRRLFSLVVCCMLPSVSIVAQKTTFETITAETVKPHIVKLSDDRLEGRGAGYKGEKAAAEYIVAEFKRIGLKPVGDAGRRSYLQKFDFHPYHAVKPWEKMQSQNVIGLVEGTDPILKSEVVVIGAHYDGQGRTGQADPTRQAGSPGAPADDIWNSANDNASSIGALIEIARELYVRKSQLKRSVLFIAFGAEEHGMTGSIYYVNHPVIPIGNHVAMINLEKLGRSPEKPLIISGVSSSGTWPEVIAASGAEVGGRPVQSMPIAFPDSDHYPFGSMQIPAILVWVSSNLDAHQPSDTADKIDFARTAEAARFAAGLLTRLANSSQRPAVVPSPMLNPGLIAHLATSAEADAAGLAAGESGLKVTGIIAGLPAAEAGLREGDLILMTGDRGFRRDKTLAALMAVYQDLLQGKLGINIPVIALRDGKRMELMLKLRK